MKKGKKKKTNRQRQKPLVPRAIPAIQETAQPRQPDTVNTQPIRPARTQPAEAQRPLAWWVTGWRLLVELGTIAGLLITIYALRPVLSVTSLDASDLHGEFGSKASITVSGMKITDVRIQCSTNKVIFDNRNTLAFKRFTRIDEYSVRDVKPGESFTGDCPFAWSFWRGSNDGILIMGSGSSGKPQLGIQFAWKNGLPVLIPGMPTPASITPNLTGYYRARTTAIDGNIVVLYKWPWSWFDQKRTIHMIARWNGTMLKWRVAPDSEPVLGDAHGGFVMTASSNSDQWGVTMGPGSPAQ